MQSCNFTIAVTRSIELHWLLPPSRYILHFSDNLSHLPFLLKFFATITIALAIRCESIRFLPGTSRSPDAIYVRILVPLTTRLMFNSKLYFGAVIWAFALEAIALCSRCIRLLRLFRVGARAGTGTARGARVTALSSQAIFHFTNYNIDGTYGHSILKYIFYQNNDNVIMEIVYQI